MDSHLTRLDAYHRVLRGINSLPRCVGHPTHPFFASVVYIWRGTAHRVVQEAGLTGCAIPIITCITKLIDPSPSQSILRNAAIPNYLIPMPFQKVTPLVIAVYAAQMSSHGMD